MIEIHPSKGYLNTKFRIFTDSPSGEKIFVSKCNDDSSVISQSFEILKGITTCTEYVFQKPGKYKLSCKGESVLVTVEDAIKLGGSNYKDSYVFSDLELSIVVMKDRMYFHDNINKIEYMEFMSPDDIKRLPGQCLLFISKGTQSDPYKEFSLFDTCTRTTISYFLDYEIADDRWLVTITGNDGNYLLEIYDLENIEYGCLQSIRCDKFSMDSQSLFFFYKHKINQLRWADYNKIDTIVPNCDVTIFVDTFGYVSETCGTLSVHTLNADKAKSIEIIHLDGRICFNEKEFDFLCREEYKKLSNILNEMESKDCKYITISENIYQVSVASCDNDFYTLIKKARLSSENKIYRIENEKSVKLFFNSEELEVSVCDSPSLLKQKDCILLYNSEKCVVIKKGYIKHVYKGKLHVTDVGIFIANSENYKRKLLYALNASGDVCALFKGNFSTEYLEKYHIIKEVDTGYIYIYNAANYLFDKLSKWEKSIYDTIYLENGFVNRNGVVCIVDDDQIFATKETIKSFGEIIEGKQDYLYFDDGEYWLEPNVKCKSSYQLFSDMMDMTKYKDVLLSSDGNYLLFREEKRMVLKEPITGETIPFDDVRFISHVNGNRPLFRVENSHRRIRIIDPVTNSEVNNDYITNYNFVSPDGKYYASTKLKKYTRFYDKIKKCDISRDEWEEQVHLYDEPLYRDGNEKGEERKNNRRQFIDSHIEYFNTLKNFDKETVIEHGCLTRYYIDMHAVCRIYCTGTDELYEEIDLGSTELNFLNYVSFSYDSRYIAIAGCYPMGCGGGLFLVYDLLNHDEIIKTYPDKAVWHTSFTPKGIVASYDSNPKTYIVNIRDLENKLDSCKELPTIDGENFMAFSTDGKYMALSEQGYIPYDENKFWGHMPSTKVIIRAVDDNFTSKAVYNDLSDEGIQGIHTKETTASVSFSSDNHKLMMVGKDGTIVIRNIHLDEV